MPLPLPLSLTLTLPLTLTLHHLYDPILRVEMRRRRRNAVHQLLCWSGVISLIRGSMSLAHRSIIFLVTATWCRRRPSSLRRNLPSVP